MSPFIFTMRKIFTEVNMIIKQTITSYLEATEQKFGSSARAKTVLKHRGGRTFFLKKHNAAHGQTINLGDLKLMIRHLKTV